MGGKGADYTPAPVDTSATDAMTAQMQQMMSVLPQMMASISQMTSQIQAPQQTPLPEIFRTPEVDWSEKHEQLRAKTKADYALDTARKGVGDTVHTSPFLDDDEASTTGSVLT